MSSSPPCTKKEKKKKNLELELLIYIYIFPRVFIPLVYSFIILSFPSTLDSYLTVFI